MRAGPNLGDSSTRWVVGRLYKYKIPSASKALISVCLNRTAHPPSLRHTQTPDRHTNDDRVGLGRGPGTGPAPPPQGLDGPRLGDQDARDVLGQREHPPAGPARDEGRARDAQVQEGAPGGVPQSQPQRRRRRRRHRALDLPPTQSRARARGPPPPIALTRARARTLAWTFALGALALPFAFAPPSSRRLRRPLSRAAFTASSVAALPPPCAVASPRPWHVYRGHIAGEPRLAGEGEIYDEDCAQGASEGATQARQTEEGRGSCYEVGSRGAREHLVASVKELLVLRIFGFGSHYGS